MVHLSEIINPAGGDNAVMMAEEDLFPEHVNKLTHSQAVCVRAAKKLEQQCTQIEIEFFAKVHELEAQFQSRFNDLNNKRAQIMNGTLSVNENEVGDVPIVYNLHEKAVEQFTKSLKEDDGVKGVPDFWLHVLQGCDATAVMIEDEDVEILKHLKNIETEVTTNPMGFILRFHFETNEYFENSVIEQKITYKLAPNDIHTFDAPSVATLENTSIQWKEGKNPLGAGKKGQHSFFSIFDAKKSDEDEMEDVYELAAVIREQIVPHATLYFTGELRDEDIDFGDSDSDNSSDSEHETMEIED
uniref:Nucleosome assembly protein n=1 Tax=Panagrolaimus superbus TaxID=310955 RepID=A0A914ZAE7_9BILA